MKSFIVSIIVSLLMISVCYSSQKRYFICTSCKMMFIEESFPKPGKCPQKKYQNFHDLKEMELCYAKY